MEGSSRTRRPWTAEDQLRAEALRAEGMGYVAIARELGRNRRTVRYNLDPATAEAIREQARKYNAADPDKARARTRRWREANPEKALESKLRSEAAYPERKAARRRRWHEANRSRELEATRRWRQANRERMREHWRRRGARKRSAGRVAPMPVKSREQLLQRFAAFGDRCAYCGAEGRLTVDHVLALTAGGLDDVRNIAPACSWCNTSKNARPVEQWYRRQAFFCQARWGKLMSLCELNTPARA